MIAYGFAIRRRRSISSCHNLSIREPPKKLTVINHSRFFSRNIEWTSQVQYIFKKPYLFQLSFQFQRIWYFPPNIPGPPLRDTDTLHLTATMTGLKRELPAFDINGLNINIKYPIELTHISHMNSMVMLLFVSFVYYTTNVYPTKPFLTPHI